MQEYKPEMLARFKKLSLILALPVLLATGLVVFSPPNVSADYEVRQGEKCASGADPTENADSKLMCPGDRPATPPPGTETQDRGATDTDDTTSCIISGVGWIVCPIVNFISEMTDLMYENIVANLLKTTPLNIETSGGTNPTYNAWSAIRNIANIVFVVAFLLIIYSQVTGLGLTNYSIKKMLPRLILTSIFMNLSYWICAMAVDLSNISGAATYDLLEEIRERLNVGDISGWATLATFLLGAGGATAAVVGGVALVGVMTGGMAMALIGIFLPLALGAIIAVFVVVFILVARQALLFILVIIAPLAFAAFLLPNTEKFFTKWRQYFISLLVLYPVVSLMVGGAQIAGYVLIGTTNDNDNVIGATIKMMSGLFVTVVPFFLLPFMIRKYGGAGLDRMAANISAKGNKMVAPLGKFGRRQGMASFGRRWEAMKAGQVQPTRFGSGRIGRALGNTSQRATNAARRYGEWEKRGKMESQAYEDMAQENLLERLATDDAYRLQASGGDAHRADLTEARAEAGMLERLKKDATALEPMIEREYGDDTNRMHADAENPQTSAARRMAIRRRLATIGSASDAARMMGSMQSRALAQSVRPGSTSLAGTAEAHDLMDTVSKNDGYLLRGSQFNRARQAGYSAAEARADMVQNLANGRAGEQTVATMAGGNISGLRQMIQEHYDDARARGDQAGMDLAEEAALRLQTTADTIIRDPSGRLQAQMSDNRGEIETLANGGGFTF